MPLRWIGSALIFLMGFNSFLDSFFSFERGNLSVRIIPYAYKSLQVLLMLVVMFYYFQQRAVRVKIDPVFWVLAFLLTDMVASIFLAHDVVNMTDLARVIFWIAVMFTFYLLRQTDSVNEEHLYWAVLFNIFWICARIMLYKLFGLWIGVAMPFDNDGVVNNLSYSLIWFVPLFFLFAKRLRFPIILMVCFSMLSAFKRGALVGFILGFILYYILDRVVNKEKDHGSVALDMVKLGVVLGFAVVGFFMFQEHIMARMSDFNGEKAMGSSREDFYKITLDHWKAFDPLNKFIGGGFFQVMPMLGLYYEDAIPAHSDWLEILYDQGIVGVTLLTLFQFMMISRIVRAVRRRYFYAPYIAYTYVIFFLGCVYSIMFFTFETSWFGLSMGYYLGTDALQKNLGRRVAGPDPGLAKPQNQTT